MSSSLLLLEAARLAASGRMDDLETLLVQSPQFAKTRKEDVLHVLLVLTPELLEPHSYMGLVTKVGTDTLASSGSDDTSTNPELDDDLILSSDLPPQILAAREHKLLQHIDGVVPAPVGNFLEERIRLVYKATQQTHLVGQLLDECTRGVDPEQIPTWIKGVPLVLVNYTRLHGPNQTLTIDLLENGDPHSVLELLGAHLTRDSAHDDFTLVVGPYVQYKQAWAELQQFIQEKTQSDTPLLATLVSSIDYPAAEADGFARQVLKNSFEADDTQWDALAAISQSPMVTGAPNLTSHFTRELVETCRLLEPAVPAITLQRAHKVATSDEEHQLDMLNDFVYASDWQQRTSDQWKTFITATEILVSLKTVFSLLSEETINTAVFQAQLKAAQFQVAKDTYITTGLVPSDVVEESIINQFYAFYDMASNGNFTRGSMKSAKQVLALASKDTLKNKDYKVAEALLESTNALSHYSLTLKPGVITKPVDIRHHDVLELINRVLEMNPDGYKECEKLTKITQQLLLGTDQADKYSITEIKAHIYSMACTAALVHDDFLAAYTLCLDQLDPLGQDDLTWVACFQAGKYVSPNWNMEEFSPGILDIVEKKLAVLSTSLAKCPQEHLSAVLMTWRDAEYTLTTLWEQAAQYEPASDSTFGDALGQTSSFFNASQLSNTLSSSAAAIKDRGFGLPQLPKFEPGERKRDQLSNMLVSGLGWAIGAPQE